MSLPGSQVRLHRQEVMGKLRRITRCVFLTPCRLHRVADSNRDGSKFCHDLECIGRSVLIHMLREYPCYSVGESEPTKVWAYAHNFPEPTQTAEAQIAEDGGSSCGVGMLPRSGQCVPDYRI